MWSPDTGDLLPLAHTEGWFWSQGQVVWMCSQDLCVQPAWSATSCKYIHQNTQKTLTTARSHTHTHTHYVCVYICVYLCICVYIFIYKCLSQLSLTQLNCICLPLIPTHKNALCLSFPGSLSSWICAQCSASCSAFSISSSLAFWCQRELVRQETLQGHFSLLENAWLWRLSEVEVGAGWQPGTRE